MIRVALKFCGGCDPAYDRTAYWEAVRERAEGSVEWVSLEEGGYEAVLIINGCDTACLSEELESGKLEIREAARVVSVKDDRLEPARVVRDILGLGA